jgi:hypothetical protein
MPATYSFLDTQVAITGPGGSFNIGGSGAGNAEEGITIEMAEDKNTMAIGADGTPMHSLHAGQGGRITVRLLKNSPVNAQLSSLYATQSVSSALWGQNVITLKNATLGDSITGTFCAFKKFPNNPYAKEGGVMEWEFDVGQLVSSLGGGGNAANILNSLVSNVPIGAV